MVIVSDTRNSTGWLPPLESSSVTTIVLIAPSGGSDLQRLPLKVWGFQSALLQPVGVCGFSIVVRDVLGVVVVTEDAWDS